MDYLLKFKWIILDFVIVFFAQKKNCFEKNGSFCLNITLIR